MLISRDFTNSPFHVACDLVERLTSGVLPLDAFLAHLDTFEGYLRRWYQALEEVPLPPEYEEGEHLLAASREALEMTYQSVELLREFGNSRRTEDAETALELAEEGHQLMAEVLGQTERNMDELENDMLSRRHEEVRL